MRDFESKKISDNYFLSQYLLRYQIVGTLTYGYSKHREFKKDKIDCTIDYLLLYFINVLIDYYDNINVFSSKHLPESKILNEFENCFEFEKFIHTFEDNNQLNINLIKITYYSYKIVKDKKDSESYELLKELLFKLKDSLAYEYMRIIIVKLYNFCNYQELGKRKYYQNELIDIYKLWIEEAPAEEANEIFGITAIRNIIKAMIEVDRLDEIEIFIDTYSGYFDQEIRDDCINYAYVRLHFAREEYEQCLEKISRHNFKVPMMIKDMKLLKIHTCYMLGFYDLLYSEIDTYRHFLSSTSGISKDFIDSDKNVLRYFHRVTKVTEKQDKKELEYFYGELTNLSSENIYINWISSKVKQVLVKE